MTSKEEKFTEILKYLEDTIDKKSRSKDNDSYIYKLSQKGLNRITQKFGEEAVEVIIAAGSDNKQDLICETADLVFHLLILLRRKKLSIEDIAKELVRRKND
tara:strand:+ start:58 stop:363 length:306 start_codon:yes stop_codon:yes gene_type:complete